LLNVGPTAEGLFPEESVAILEKMGEWVQKNGAAIYDSKPWVHHAEGDGIRYTANKDGSVNVFMKPSAWKYYIAEHLAQTSGTKQPQSMIRGAHTLLKQARLTNDSLRYFEFNNGIGALVQTTEGLVVQLGRIQLPKSDEIIMITLPLVPASVATKPIIGDGKQIYVFSEKMDVPIHQMGTEQQIRFTLDGTEPHPESPLYSTPIVIQQSGILQSRAYQAGKISSPTAVARFVRADAGISINVPPATQYAGLGDITLLDRQYGSIDFHKGNWLGFSGKDVIVTLDLGQKKEVTHFAANFLRRQSAWIFLPKAIEWSVSDDGDHWNTIKTEESPIAVDTAADTIQKLEFTQKTTTRYVRLLVRAQGRCPSWHAGAGGEAWLFLDEVEVR
jgi:F5/8 type C domain/Fn3 associated/Alpha-L-fucosidase